MRSQPIPIADDASGVREIEAVCRSRRNEAFAERTARDGSQRIMLRI